MEVGERPQSLRGFNYFRLLGATIPLPKLIVSPEAKENLCSSMELDSLMKDRRLARFAVCCFIAPAGNST